MVALDIVHELLQASDILTEAQKQWWNDRLPHMSADGQRQLYHLLKEEADTRNDTLKKVLDSKKIYAQKKLKALYEFAEKKIKQEEASELASLDQEFQSLTT